MACLVRIDLQVHVDPHGTLTNRQECVGSDESAISADTKHTPNHHTCIHTTHVTHTCTECGHTNILLKCSTHTGTSFTFLTGHKTLVPRKQLRAQASQATSLITQHNTNTHAGNQTSQAKGHPPLLWIFPGYAQSIPDATTSR